MEKKEVTIADIRKVLTANFDVNEVVENMSDADLLRLKPCYDLWLDSLDITEISILLEKELGVVFKYDVIDNWKQTDEDIASLLQICNKSIVRVQ